MNKALLALVLISLIGMFVVGCKATTPGTPAPIGNGNEPAIAGEQAGTGVSQNQTGNGAAQTADNSITGQINDLDSLTSDLNDPEIKNTENLINEINW
jgi:hypothetical protein